jgi:hypothetical protein
MDPGHVLPAGSNGSTDARAERREHLRQCSTVPPEHYSCPEQYEAQPECLGAACSRLPVVTQLGQKVVSGRRILGQHLVAAVAVISDGTARYEDSRSCAGGCEGPNEFAGEIHPAFAQDPPPRFRPPTAQDRFARQVYYRIALFEVDGQCGHTAARLHDLDFCAQSTAGASV